MRKDIHKFLHSQDHTLIINHDKERNILFEWTNIRSPLKLISNGITSKVARYLPLRLKLAVMRHMLGMKIGKNVGISFDVEIDPCYPEIITIEDNACIGIRTTILTHEFTQDSLRIGRVTLEKGCLVGAFCIVRAGVRVGQNSIIAMNSFVNRDIPPNEMWGGVPVRFIRKLDQADATAD